MHLVVRVPIPRDGAGRSCRHAMSCHVMLSIRNHSLYKPNFISSPMRCIVDKMTSLEVNAAAAAVSDDFPPLSLLLCLAWRMKANNKYQFPSITVYPAGMTCRSYDIVALSPSVRALSYRDCHVIIIYSLLPNRQQK